MPERMMFFVLQLGAILLAARFGGWIAKKLRLAAVLGEVILGMLIGPYVLGQLPFYGFPEGLFPRIGGFPLSPELYAVCSLGSILLLFTVGLETNIRLLYRYSVPAILAGAGGVVVSFVAGDLVTVACSNWLFGTRLTFMSAPCLVLGVVATATSVGIAARILSTKRKLDTPEGITILAAAIIDDVAGVVLLAIVLGVLSAREASADVAWGHVGAVAIRAIGVWLAATAIGLAASRKIGQALKLSQDRATIAIVALALALILAGVFEDAGLAMIVGAYVMGLSLSHTDIRDVVRDALAPVCGLLVPVFFCGLGMLIDVRALAAGPVLAFGVAYTVVAILSKVVGCGAPMLLCGFNSLGAARVGFGMLPRCEIALTITAIALARGVVGQEVVGVAVLLMFITTIVAPAGLVALFSTDRSGMRRPVVDAARTSVSFAFPSPAMTDLVTRTLLGVTANEGFFSHRIPSEPPLYQLRKDDMLVEVRQRDRELEFYCRSEDVAMVNAAMYEVGLVVDQVLVELRAPLDEDALARRWQDASPRSDHLLDVADFAPPGALVPDLTGATPLAVIKELFDRISFCDAIGDGDEALSAVLKRVEEAPPGLQHGVAIPHAAAASVGRIVCAIGLHREGVDFGSADGEPSRIVILILSPKDAPAPHIQFMMSVGQLLDEDGRRRMLACETAEQMRATLRDLWQARRS